MPEFLFLTHEVIMLWQPHDLTSAFETCESREKFSPMTIQKTKSISFEPEVTRFFIF